MKPCSRTILIAGPTASGKSALALRLADRLGGGIVNADSMQCYRDLRILTARPGPADEDRVEHRLYGTIDGATAHSVSDWLADADRTLRALWDGGRVAIVVGGTGLYFKALVDGLSDIPLVPEPIRCEIRAWASDRPAAAIHQALARLDPVMADRLRPTDPQRLVRAYEVVVATGRSLATFQTRRAPSILASTSVCAVTLTTDDHVLQPAIERRIATMIADGAVDEVAALLGRGLPLSLPVMRAIGVAPLADLLRGDASLAEASAAMQIQTRRYVKRQRTFFRTQLNFRPCAVESAERTVMETCQSA